MAGSHAVCRDEWYGDSELDRELVLPSTPVDLITPFRSLTLKGYPFEVSSTMLPALDLDLDLLPYFDASLEAMSWYNPLPLPQETWPQHEYDDTWVIPRLEPVEGSADNTTIPSYLPSPPLPARRSRNSAARASVNPKRLDILRAARRPRQIRKRKGKKEARPDNATLDRQQREIKQYYESCLENKATNSESSAGACIW